MFSMFSSRRDATRAALHLDRRYLAAAKAREKPSVPQPPEKLQVGGSHIELPKELKELKGRFEYNQCVKGSGSDLVLIPSILIGLEVFVGGLGIWARVVSNQVISPDGLWAAAGFAGILGCLIIAGVITKLVGHHKAVSTEEKIKGLCVEKKISLNSVFGTGSGARTHTMLPSPDFESGASTSSAIPAQRDE